MNQGGLTHPTSSFIPCHASMFVFPQAAKGHVPVARLLLKQGADVNRQDITGSTPLHRASSAGKRGVTSMGQGWCLMWAR